MPFYLVIYSLNEVISVRSESRFSDENVVAHANYLLIYSAIEAQGVEQARKKAELIGRQYRTLHHGHKW